MRLTFSAISEFMFCLYHVLQRVHLIRQIHGRKIGKVKKRIRNPIFGVDFFDRCWLNVGKLLFIFFLLQWFSFLCFVFLCCCLNEINIFM